MFNDNLFNLNQFAYFVSLLLAKHSKPFRESLHRNILVSSRKENENKVWRNLYPEFGGKTLTPKFSIGDNVRITQKKKTFDKGYTQRWTEQIFIISKIQLTIPVTYKISDYNGEEIQRTFYDQELQKTAHYSFRNKKVLQRQGNKSLVKWMGNPKSFNSWIDTKNELPRNRFKTLKKNIN